MLGTVKLRTPSVILDTSLRSLGLLALLGVFTLPVAAEITVTGDFSPDEPFWTNGGDPDSNGRFNSGTNSLLINNDSRLQLFNLDVAGDTSVTINSGGELFATRQADFSSNSANITISVDGVGSTMQIGDLLGVGRFGNADLSISNQAVVDVEGRAIISFPGHHESPTGEGNLILNQGTLNAATLFSRPQNLKGTGTINTNGLMRDGWDGFEIDFNGSNVFQTKLTDNGKDIDLTITANGKGNLGAGNLLVRNGANIQTDNTQLGYHGTAGTTAIVTGPGSTWTNDGDSFDRFNVGQYAEATLIIEKGGTVNSKLSFVGRDRSDSTGTVGEGMVIIQDSGSSWNVSRHLRIAQSTSQNNFISVRRSGTLNTVDVMLGDSVSNSRGTITVKDAGSVWNSSGTVMVGAGSHGVANVAKGGQVNVADDIVIKSEATGSGSMNIYVSGDGMVNAGTDGTGDFSNSGIVRLFAGQGLAVGTYTPITVGADEGDFTGSGTYEAFGGIWNDAAHTFTVGSLLDGSGGIVETNLTGQRYEFSFGGNPEALLTASFGAGAGIADFSVLQLDLDSISGESTLAVFDFTTNLADGTNVLLSYFVGENFDEDAIAFWHSEDGLAWTVYTPDTWVYADGWVSFLVDGFSGYAVTVPEPASGSLLLGAGAVWLLRRRKHQRELSSR